MRDTMLENVKIRLNMFFNDEIEREKGLQKEVSDLGDIVPTLVEIRDHLLDCTEMSQLRAIRNDEISGRQELSMKIYHATAGDKVFGDSDYTDAIKNAIVSIIPE